MKRTQTTSKVTETKEVIAKKRKRTVTKAAAKKKAEAVIDIEDTDRDDDEGEMDTSMTHTSNTGLTPRKMLTVLILVAIIGALGYRILPFAVPVSVNGKPVFAWEYLRTLHAQYGREHMQTLVTQKIIEQAVADSKVTVAAADIDKEIDTIDKQASSSGGIKALLSAQNLTMEQLKDQIRIQLAVKQILKDKIQVSDSEVDEAYKKNKDFFKGKSEADAKKEIREQLEAQKFQKEASAWVGEIRNKAVVKYGLPSLDASAQ